MAKHQIESLEDYAQCLEQTPQEAEALLAEMHIGVTSFFRDESAFQALGQLLLEYAQGKPLRLWSAGCSTGEEAYSLAILLQELALTKAKIFATDIHGPSIVSARRGVYPASLAQELSPTRLQRFFRLDPKTGSYRVRKVIRETLIFSQHDVTKDPPFSKLDGISCRNLLIYFNREWQRKLIDLFHYALRPQGILFLGNSESIGPLDDLFQLLDRKERIYQRKESASIAAMERFRDFLPIRVRSPDIQDL